MLLESYFFFMLIGVLSNAFFAPTVITIFSAFALAEITSGKSMIVSTCEPGGFTSSPSGKAIDAEITVCLKDDLTGSCTTQKIAYKPD